MAHVTFHAGRVTSHERLSNCSQGSIGGANSVLRMEVVKVTDKRVTFMSEILAAIRLIKTYAWEESFKEQVIMVLGASKNMFVSCVP